MAHFFPGWYDETLLENQEWQGRNVRLRIRNEND